MCGPALATVPVAYTISAWDSLIPLHEKANHSGFITIDTQPGRFTNQGVCVRNNESPVMPVER
jgi:hypothetical protein